MPMATVTMVTAQQPALQTAIVLIQIRQTATVPIREAQTATVVIIAIVVILLTQTVLFLGQATVLTARSAQPLTVLTAKFVRLLTVPIARTVQALIALIAMVNHICNQIATVPVHTIVLNRR